MLMRGTHTVRTVRQTDPARHKCAQWQWKGGIRKKRRRCTQSRWKNLLLGAAHRASAQRRSGAADRSAHGTHYLLAIISCAFPGSHLLVHSEEELLPLSTVTFLCSHFRCYFRKKNLCSEVSVCMSYDSAAAVTAACLNDWLTVWVLHWCIFHWPSLFFLAWCSIESAAPIQWEQVFISLSFSAVGKLSLHFFLLQSTVT